MPALVVCHKCVIVEVTIHYGLNVDPFGVCRFRKHLFCFLWPKVGRKYMLLLGECIICILLCIYLGVT